MCYNSETSLISYIVSTSTALYVINGGTDIKKILGGILLIFCTIQLLEFLIWTQRKRNNLSYNSRQAVQSGADNRMSSDVITRLILVALWLQPLGLTYLTYRYGNSNKLLAIALLVYLTLFTYSLSRAMNPQIVFGSRPFVGVSENGLSGQGHLEWISSDGEFIGPYGFGALYIVGLFFGLLFTKPASIGFKAILFNVFPMLYSYFYHTREEFSSMWCIYALLFAGFIVMID